jgi:N-acetyl-gamma-glutamyl-phosphate/LysW-gamma-L-alpha-aminoadipyl-6-phosphate reductase
MLKAGIVGGSGYAGGELLRLLNDHPDVEVIQSTSRAKTGQFVYQTHPNLRGRTQLKFSSPDELSACDVLFLALPHGRSQQYIEKARSAASHIVDLAGDFRLNDAGDYETWYGEPHQTPEYLSRFVYGLPEVQREALKSAQLVSGVGCNASATILALLPLVLHDLLDTQSVVVDIKVGSSEAGASANASSHHPERSSVVRTFSAFGHRHTAEVIQELGLKDVGLVMTAVDLVRGVLAAAHAHVKPGVTGKDLWRAYRAVAAENPFVRIVKERRGIYRVPEPKILAGSNYADIGFELDPHSQRVVATCAIDNLMKGAAGSAVQSMNLMLGLDETAGLEFPGLHPI